MQGFRKCYHRVLTNVVRTHIWRRNQPGDGSSVDDISRSALLQHDRDEGADSVNNAPHVDAQHPVPIRESTIPKKTDAPDSSIVEEQIYNAKFFHGPLSEGFNFLSL